MTVKQLLTAEDVWALPERPGVRYELADGELIEVPGAGLLHNLLVGLLYRLLDDFVRREDLGLVFTDGTAYVLRRGPDLVRIPDVSFVAWERLPAGDVPEGFGPFAPDLAVEVVSPGDRAEDVRRKVREYLAAGTRRVWVLWPREPSVTVHESGGVLRELGPDDELDGGDVVPGFRVRVAELFAVRRQR